MKFEVNRQKFLNKLVLNAKIIKKSRFGVQEGIEITAKDNNIELYSADETLHLKQSFYTPNLSEAGYIKISGLLINILRVLPDETVKFEATKTSLIIKGKNYDFKLNAIDKNALGAVVSDEINLVAGILYKEWHDVMKKAMLSAEKGRTDNRAYLSAIHFYTGGSLKLVATDSYRMFFRQLKTISITDEIEKLSIPARAIQNSFREDFKPDDVVLIGTFNNSAVISIKDLRIEDSIVEANRDFLDLIPKEFNNEVLISKKEIEPILKRVAGMKDFMIGYVKFIIKDEVLKIVAENKMIGFYEEEIKIKWLHQKNPIEKSSTSAFNPEYLYTGISIADNDSIVYKFQDEPLKPVLISSGNILEDNKQDYLIMPIRTSD